MQHIRFDFYGRTHDLAVPDGQIYEECAREIIEGLAYPFPKEDLGPPVKSVVDLGAHAGEFTIMAATRWPEATIHAFEPNPQILDYLRRNCAPYRNIVIHEQAVDVRPRTDRLYFNQIGSVAASVVRPEGGEKEDWDGAEVEIVGPDAVVRLQPDVLKLDIEGPEGVILAAMGGAVLALIHRIYVEFHGETVRRHLEQLLLPTHQLAYARIVQARQGEVMYLRREK